MVAALIYADLGLDGAIGERGEKMSDVVGERVGVGNGFTAEGEEVGEVVVVREEVGLDFGLDFEGVGVEALDEEAEIRCGGVAQVLRGEELPDVD